MKRVGTGPLSGPLVDSNNIMRKDLGFDTGLGLNPGSNNKEQTPTGANNKKQHRLKQRFNVVKKLGKGTYGKVQLAINKETGQEVAIKTIKKTKIESEQDLVRIRREIQIMSSIEHPHIVHIYEVFENKDKIVLVMQYASGGELYEYVSQSKLLDDNEARRLFRQIATAIYYCHQNKICHRDLKLENILLDERNNAKIADFGLSNVFDVKHQLRTFCGSPLYASPEIVNGSPYIGHEVDCWSLGVLLYTLVYGAMPFDGSNFKRLVKQISEASYFEPKQKSQASPLIRKLLTADPTKRATIIDICLDPWVNGSSVAASCDISDSPIEQQQQQPNQHHHSLLKVAEDMANLTPVRFDILLALAPVSPPLDQATDSVLPNKSVAPDNQEKMDVGNIENVGNVANIENNLQNINEPMDAPINDQPRHSITTQSSSVEPVEMADMMAEQQQQQQQGHKRLSSESMLLSKDAVEGFSGLPVASFVVITTNNEISQPEENNLENIPPAVDDEKHNEQEAQNRSKRTRISNSSSKDNARIAIDDATNHDDETNNYDDGKQEIQVTNVVIEPIYQLNTTLVNSETLVNLPASTPEPLMAVSYGSCIQNVDYDVDQSGQLLSNQEPETFEEPKDTTAEHFMEDEPTGDDKVLIVSENNQHDEIAKDIEMLEDPKMMIPTENTPKFKNDMIEIELDPATVNEEPKESESKIDQHQQQPIESGDGTAGKVHQETSSTAAAPEKKKVKKKVIVKKKKKVIAKTTSDGISPDNDEMQSKSSVPVDGQVSKTTSKDSISSSNQQQNATTTKPPVVTKLLAGKTGPGKLKIPKSFQSENNHQANQDHNSSGTEPPGTATLTGVQSRRSSIPIGFTSIVNVADVTKKIESQPKQIANDQKSPKVPLAIGPTLVKVSDTKAAFERKASLLSINDLSNISSSSSSGNISQQSLEQELINKSKLADNVPTDSPTIDLNEEVKMTSKAVLTLSSFPVNLNEIDNKQNEQQQQNEEIDISERMADYIISLEKLRDAAENENPTTPTTTSNGEEQQIQLTTTTTTTNKFMQIEKDTKVDIVGEEEDGDDDDLVVTLRSPPPSTTSIHRLSIPLLFGQPDGSHHELNKDERSDSMETLKPDIRLSKSGSISSIIANSNLSVQTSNLIGDSSENKLEVDVVVDDSVEFVPEPQSVRSTFEINLCPPSKSHPDSSRIIQTAGDGFNAPTLQQRQQSIESLNSHKSELLSHQANNKQTMSSRKVSSLGLAPIARSYKKVTFTKDGACITESGKIYSSEASDGSFTRVERKSKITHYTSDQDLTNTNNGSEKQLPEQQQQQFTVPSGFDQGDQEDQEDDNNRLNEAYSSECGSFTTNSARNNNNNKDHVFVSRSGSESSCSSGSTDAFDDIFDTWTGGGDNFFNQDFMRAGGGGMKNPFSQAFPQLSQDLFRGFFGGQSPFVLPRLFSHQQQQPGGSATTNQGEPSTSSRSKSPFFNNHKQREDHLGDRFRNRPATADLFDKHDDFFDPDFGQDDLFSSTSATSSRLLRQQQQQQQQRMFAFDNDNHFKSSLFDPIEDDDIFNLDPHRNHHTLGRRRRKNKQDMPGGKDSWKGSTPSLFTSHNNNLDMRDSPMDFSSTPKQSQQGNLWQFIKPTIGNDPMMSNFIGVESSNMSRPPRMMHRRSPSDMGAHSDFGSNATRFGGDRSSKRSEFVLNMKQPTNNFRTTGSQTASLTPLLRSNNNNQLRASGFNFKVVANDPSDQHHEATFNQTPIISTQSIALDSAPTRRNTIGQKPPSCSQLSGANQSVSGAIDNPLQQSSSRASLTSRMSSMNLGIKRTSSAGKCDKARELLSQTIGEKIIKQKQQQQISRDATGLIQQQLQQRQIIQQQQQQHIEHSSSGTESFFQQQRERLAQQKITKATTGYYIIANNNKSSLINQQQQQQQQQQLHQSSLYQPTDPEMPQNEENPQARIEHWLRDSGGSNDTVNQGQQGNNDTGRTGRSLQNIPGQLSGDEPLPNPRCSQGVSGQTQNRGFMSAQIDLGGPDFSRNNALHMYGTLGRNPAKTRQHQQLQQRKQQFNSSKSSFVDSNNRDTTNQQHLYITRDQQQQQQQRIVSLSSQEADGTILQEDQRSFRESSCQSSRSRNEMISDSNSLKQQTTKINTSSSIDNISTSRSSMRVNLSANASSKTITLPPSGMFHLMQQRSASSISASSSTSLTTIDTPAAHTNHQVHQTAATSTVLTTTTSTTKTCARSGDDDYVIDSSKQQRQQQHQQFVTTTQANDHGQSLSWLPTTTNTNRFMSEQQRHHEEYIEQQQQSSSSSRAIPSSAPIDNSGQLAFQWRSPTIRGSSGQAVDDQEEPSSLLEQLRARGYRSIVNQRLSRKLESSSSGDQLTTIIDQQQQRQQQQQHYTSTNNNSNVQSTRVSQSQSNSNNNNNNQQFIISRSSSSSGRIKVINTISQAAMTRNDDNDTSDASIDDTDDATDDQYRGNVLKIVMQLHRDKHINNDHANNNNAHNLLSQSHLHPHSHPHQNKSINQLDQHQQNNNNYFQENNFPNSNLCSFTAQPQPAILPYDSSFPTSQSSDHHHHHRLTATKNSPAVVHQPGSIITSLVANCSCSRSRSSCSCSCSCSCCCEHVLPTLSAQSSEKLSTALIGSDSIDRVAVDSVVEQSERRDNSSLSLNNKSSSFDGSNNPCHPITAHAAPSDHHKPVEKPSQVASSLHSHQSGCMVSLVGRNSSCSIMQTNSSKLNQQENETKMYDSNNDICMAESGSANNNLNNNGSLLATCHCCCFPTPTLTTQQPNSSAANYQIRSCSPGGRTRKLATNQAPVVSLLPFSSSSSSNDYLAGEESSKQTTSSPSPSPSSSSSSGSTVQASPSPTHDLDSNSNGSGQICNFSTQLKDAAKTNQQQQQQQHLSKTIMQDNRDAATAAACSHHSHHVLAPDLINHQLMIMPQKSSMHIDTTNIDDDCCRKSTASLTSMPINNQSMIFNNNNNCNLKLSMLSCPMYPPPPPPPLTAVQQQQSCHNNNNNNNNETTTDNESNDNDAIKNSLDGGSKQQQQQMDDKRGCSLSDEQKAQLVERQQIDNDSEKQDTDDIEDTLKAQRSSSPLLSRVYLDTQLERMRETQEFLKSLQQQEQLNIQQRQQNQFYHTLNSLNLFQGKPSSSSSRQSCSRRATSLSRIDYNNSDDGQQFIYGQVKPSVDSDSNFFMGSSTAPVNGIYTSAASVSSSEYKSSSAITLAGSERPWCWPQQPSTSTMICRKSVNGRPNDDEYDDDDSMMTNLNANQSIVRPQTPRYNSTLGFGDDDNYSSWRSNSLVNKDSNHGSLKSCQSSSISALTSSYRTTHNKQSEGSKLGANDLIFGGHHHSTSKIINPSMNSNWKMGTSDDITRATNYSDFRDLNYDNNGDKNYNDDDDDIDPELNAYRPSAYIPASSCKSSIGLSKVQARITARQRTRSMQFNAVPAKLAITSDIKRSNDSHDSSSLNHRRYSGSSVVIQSALHDDDDDHHNSSDERRNETRMRFRENNNDNFNNSSTTRRRSYSSSSNSGELDNHAKDQSFNNRIASATTGTDRENNDAISRSYQQQQQQFGKSGKSGADDSKSRMKNNRDLSEPRSISRNITYRNDKGELGDETTTSDSLVDGSTSSGGSFLSKIQKKSKLSQLEERIKARKERTLSLLSSLSTTPTNNNNNNNKDSENGKDVCEQHQNLGQTSSLQHPRQSRYGSRVAVSGDDDSKQQLKNTGSKVKGAPLGVRSINSHRGESMEERIKRKSYYCRLQEEPHSSSSSSTTTRRSISNGTTAPAALHCNRGILSSSSYATSSCLSEASDSGQTSSINNGGQSNNAANGVIGSSTAASLADSGIVNNSSFSSIVKSQIE